MGAIRHGGASAWMGMLVRLAAPISSKLAFKIPVNQEYSIEKIRGVFIICPPRSGGTAIYQAISHALPAIPLTNGHVLFLSHGSRIYRRYKQSDDAFPAQFDNFNGYTSKLYGVNEGNEFFSWTQNPKDLQENFCRLNALLGPKDDECIVLKNVRTYENIQSFYKASQDSGIIFLRVKRDIQKIIESSLKVYRRTGVFHPIPKELQGRKISDPVRFAVEQISSIEKEIDRQLENIPEERKIEFSYEDFCEDPYKFIDDIAVNHLGFSRDDVRHIPAIDNMRVSKKQKVSEDTGKRISELLKNQLK